jgi:hypothetical protein
MQSAERVLDVLRERGRRGLPLTELYRQLFNPQLYLLAYGRIYSNKGAMTPGVDAETADGMTLGKIERIIDALRHERYRFKPVKRVYILKKDGKQRPLGLPSSDWLDELLLHPLATVRAYEHALKFDDFYELEDPAAAEEYLRRWVSEAKTSELEPLAHFAEMLETHLAGSDPLASHPRLERAVGGIELADPGSQAQSPRVPLRAQLQDDDLPRRRQAQALPSGHITVSDRQSSYPLRSE